MTEYTVHFQRGTRVGARSLRLFQIEARNYEEAMLMARRDLTAQDPTTRQYRIVRTDHFDDDGRIVIDY
jgi:hypothetical protein